MFVLCSGNNFVMVKRNQKQYAQVLPLQHSGYLVFFANEAYSIELTHIKQNSIYVEYIIIGN